MTIARVGSTTATGATLASPAGSLYDLILWSAYRSSSATAPTTPAGTISITSGGANTNSLNVAYEFATVSGAQSRTFTNATQMVAVRYSGVLGIGAAGTLSSASSTTINYPAATLVQSAGASWWVGVAGAVSATNANVAPAGMTNVTSVGTGPQLAVHDTNGATSANWASTNVTVSPTGGHESNVIELLGTNSTLSPYDKVNTTLTNANLTWESTTSAAISNGIRSFIGRATGRYMFSVTITAYNQTSPMADGVMEISGLLTNAPGFSDSLAVGFYYTSGNTAGGLGSNWINHTDTNNSSGYTVAPAVGSTIYYAFDLTLGSGWVKYSGLQGWNGNAANNPDTSTGGFGYTDVKGQFLIPFLGSGNLDSIKVVDLHNVSGAGLTTFAPWDQLTSGTVATIPNNNFVILQAVKRAGYW